MIVLNGKLTDKRTPATVSLAPPGEKNVVRVEFDDGSSSSEKEITCDAGQRCKVFLKAR